MKELHTEDLKQLQIRILKEVASFCRQNGIAFFLDAGTLLGAVRHKGYIPWDDDIDIGMLRPDFERFLREFNREGNRYQVFSIETKRDFYYPYAKVLDTGTVLYEPDRNGNRLAVNIDVFVYDRVPCDPKTVKAMYDRRDRYRKLYEFRTYRGRAEGNFLRRVEINAVRALTHLFPRGYFLQKTVRNARRFDRTDADHLGNFTSYSRICCDRRIFDSFVEVEFEGENYPAPAGYDEWLKAFYRDYMQLPPVEKRVTHHAFEAFMKEEGDK